MSSLPWTLGYLLWVLCYKLWTLEHRLPTFCGLYYKHVTIVNYASSGINKLRASLNDDASVIIYDRHMFIVQAGNTKGGSITVQPDGWTDRQTTQTDRAENACGLVYSGERETDRPGNTKGGSITVPLSSCLTGLESAV